MKRNRTLIMACLISSIVGWALFLAAPPAMGIISVGKGNDPVHDP